MQLIPSLALLALAAIQAFAETSLEEKVVRRGVNLFPFSQLAHRNDESIGLFARQSCQLGYSECTTGCCPLTSPCCSSSLGTGCCDPGFYCDDDPEDPAEPCTCYGSLCPEGDDNEDSSSSYSYTSTSYSSSYSPSSSDYDSSSSSLSFSSLPTPTYTGAVDVNDTVSGGGSPSETGGNTGGGSPNSASNAGGGGSSSADKNINLAASLMVMVAGAVGIAAVIM